MGVHSTSTLPIFMPRMRGGDSMRCAFCSEHIFEDDFVTFTFCCQEQQTAQEEAVGV